MSTLFINKGGCSSTSCLRDTQMVADFDGSNSMCHLFPQSAILQRSALISAAALNLKSLVGITFSNVESSAYVAH